MKSLHAAGTLSRENQVCGVQLKSFLHVLWSFPLNNLLQFSFHVTHHHMIYRQASTYNCIALITFHCFYSLLLFSLLSQYLSYDLLDQSFLSPFIKIPSERPQLWAALSRAGGSLRTLLPGECCSFGALHLSLALSECPLRHLPSPWPLS